LLLLPFTTAFFKKVNEDNITGRIKGSVVVKKLTNGWQTDVYTTAAHTGALSANGCRPGTPTL
jgi:hypothetical protein